MIDDAITAVSKELDKISADHVNEVVTIAARELVKSGDFQMFNPQLLSYFYESVIKGYIAAVEMKFNRKKNFALEAVKNPDMVRAAMNDPEYERTKRDLGL